MQTTTDADASTSIRSHCIVSSENPHNPTLTPVPSRSLTRVTEEREPGTPILTPQPKQTDASNQVPVGERQGYKWLYMVFVIMLLNV